MNLSAINKVTAGRTKTTGISDFAELEMSKIYANESQPRKSFENLEELALSIKENGLIQPIAVTKTDKGYMIISGERRYRASLLNSSKTIKSHIIQADEKQILELALVENIQREDLTDFEKAVYIGKLWASGNYETKKELSQAIGKAQSYISKAFSCLRLDTEITADLESAKHNIGLSVLEEIARVEDKKIQKEVYELILKKEITRDEIKNFKNLKGWDETKVTEVPGIKINTKRVFVSYGFGTLNDMGNFISLSSGDLDGRIAIDTEDFVKHSNNNNYKITIEEI